MTEKPRVREVIIVEGRYDKNTVSQCVDATVVEISGFAVQGNPELRQYIRTLAEERGAVILTDSDDAGLQLRNYLRRSLKDCRVLHAYIPEIIGRERRKRSHTRRSNNLLGVEGMSREVLLKALRDCGATLDGEASALRGALTSADLYALGLSGTDNAAERRTRLLSKLGLPTNLGSKAMLGAVNILYSHDEFIKILEEL
ncbi:MAG: DUF4093 domain-containing protein [Oscillospiraceae bacterium]|jgi:ribonuclease M5|nr:DUF4093 domain-containing protein [Oscillospiraceae bacterium]